MALLSRDVNLVIVVLMVLLSIAQSDVFNVVDYGAIGDGIADDAQAFLRAWTDMCRSTTLSPILLLEPGKTFLLSPITFNGPCSSPDPRVQILGNIVAPSTMSAWSGSQSYTWLAFYRIDGLIIEGNGQIDGQGPIWWNNTCPIQRCTRPTALTLGHCNRLRLIGIRHLNSARNHISIVGCNDVLISNINISAPEDSLNTDGIDISSSSHIEIRDSSIGTGDDCIAINGGTSFVNITNLNCGPGHGISVGSLGKNGAHDTAEEIHVQNCNFTRTMCGVRVKTWQGGKGYARNISFRQIQFVDVKYPILIDQFYCPSRRGCKNYTSAVEISDVTFEEIQGTSLRPEAISLLCSQSLGCNNIIMNHIDIRSSTETHSECLNAHGRAISTSPSVPCLSQSKDYYSKY